MLNVKKNEVSKEKLRELLLVNPVDEFTIECTEKWSIVLNGEITYIPSLLESIIEGAGMSCRIYTRGRVAPIAPWLVVPGVGQVIAAAAAVAVVAHNVATYNPDFEIRKNSLKGNVLVTNLKKIEIDNKKIETDKMLKKQSK